MEVEIAVSLSRELPDVAKGENQRCGGGPAGTMVTPGTTYRPLGRRSADDLLRDENGTPRLVSESHFALLDNHICPTHARVSAVVFDPAVVDQGWILVQNPRRMVVRRLNPPGRPCAMVEVKLCLHSFTLVTALNKWFSPPGARNHPWARGSGQICSRCVRCVLSLAS